MVNYSLGKIYKLVDNTNGNIYIGSTCQSTLAQRLTKHVCECKRVLENKANQTISSYEIIKNGNYDIVLLESYPCNSKDELFARERFYIENTNCVNKRIPLRTVEETKVIDKQTAKLYRLKNRDTILEKEKQYRIDFKDKIKEIKKKSNAKNNDKIIEYRKTYYERTKDIFREERNEYFRTHYNQNREQIRDYNSQKFQCICGRLISYGSKSRHLKSKIHSELCQMI